MLIKGFIFGQLLDFRKNIKTKQKKELKTYQTTQLLDIVEHIDGSVVKNYATTTFAIISSGDVPEDQVTSNSFRIMSSSPNSDDKWDPTYGVRAYSTIYWDDWTDPRGMDYYDLKKVSGGWDIQDSQISLTDREVTVGANGWVWNEFPPYQQQYEEFSPTPFTYNYSSAAGNWNFFPVSASEQYAVGSSSVATVHYKQSSNTYLLDFSNNI